MDDEADTPGHNTNHDDQGQFATGYTDGEFLEAVYETEGLAGTTDVANAVGCSYETAIKRLSELADNGMLDTQKVANARIWMIESDTDI